MSIRYTCNAEMTKSVKIRQFMDWTVQNLYCGPTSGFSMDRLKDKWPLRPSLLFLSLIAAFNTVFNVARMCMRWCSDTAVGESELFY